MSNPTSPPDEGQSRKVSHPLEKRSLLISKPQYRASDEDRENLTQLLGRALGQGLIDIHEFDRRLQTVYRAKTHLELEVVTHDLQVESLTVPHAVVPGSGPGTALLFGFFGGIRRRGHWVLPRRLHIFILMGGGFLDLREASFVSPHTRINVWSFFGRTKIIVPHELDLRVEGMEMIGDFDDKASGQGDPGRPSIVVNGIAVLSGVHVERPYTKKKPVFKRILRGGR